MKKKIISIFTLVAFAVFSISCYSTRVKEVRTATDWYWKKGKIFSVVKTSGEYIEFSEDFPGQIYGDKIVGNAIIMSKEAEIDLTNIVKIRRHSDRNIFEIIDKEGKIYRAVGIAKEEEDKIIYFTPYPSSELVSIPLSEVKLLRIKRLDTLISASIMAGTLAAVFLFAINLGKGYDSPFRY